MKALLAMITVTVATPVLAGPVLWKNVESGMTVDQIHGLFPEEKGRVVYHNSVTVLKGFVEIDKCRPEVSVEHHKGVVTEVVVTMPSLGLKATCTEEAHQAMLEKFGKPISEVGEDRVAIGTKEKYQEITLTWIKDGIGITFWRQTLSYEQPWSVTYKAIGVSSGL